MDNEQFKLSADLLYLIAQTPCYFEADEQFEQSI
jgi:hypothetical protein